jgi:hypothetical protein
MFLFSTSFLLSQSIEEDYTKVKSNICLKALKSGKVIDEGNNDLEYYASIIYDEKIYFLFMDKKMYTSKDIARVSGKWIPNKVKCYNLNKME